MHLWCLASLRDHGLGYMYLHASLMSYIMPSYISCHVKTVFLICITCTHHASLHVQSYLHYIRFNYVFSSCFSHLFIVIFFKTNVLDKYTMIVCSNVTSTHTCFQLPCVPSNVHYIHDLIYLIFNPCLPCMRASNCIHT